MHIPLATADGRRKVREALADLKGRLAALTANNAYMSRHFDAPEVKPDRGDIAADLPFAHCVA